MKVSSGILQLCEIWGFTSEGSCIYARSNSAVGVNITERLSIAVSSVVTHVGTPYLLYVIGKKESPCGIHIITANACWQAPRNTIVLFFFPQSNPIIFFAFKKGKKDSLAASSALTDLSLGPVPSNDLFSIYLFRKRGPVAPSPSTSTAPAIQNDRHPTNRDPSPDIEQARKTRGPCQNYRRNIQSLLTYFVRQDEDDDDNDDDDSDKDNDDNKEERNYCYYYY
ncbi:hypothetical protein ACRALDRAFT_206491 [Sodiomyces alcalophilus JCM 7366]|uniref:uncharacterized protein n=1 Tax=Sodiomyces alcalophilus JCM 7366 TaxID=591952 RepID=UPI0039B551FC